MAKYSVRYGTVEAVQLKESAVIGNQTGVPGDYLVTWPTGKVEIYTKKDFDETFYMPNYGGYRD